MLRGSSVRHHALITLSCWQAAERAVAAAAALITEVVRTMVPDELEVAEEEVKEATTGPRGASTLWSRWTSTKSYAAES